MTGELKTKIENIWDILWSSGMTNPLTITEQITYLLFIKLIDDNELQKEATAASSSGTVNETAFDERHQNCRWHVFRQYDAETLYRNMADNVFPFIKSGLTDGKYGVYSGYLKDAVFLIPGARVLSRVTEALDSPDMSNKDIMGDVYEVLLARMAQSGRNGQFRTPRHIIKMIVELVRPSITDEICDPAMGSAGFLCAAAQYIREHYTTESESFNEKYNTTMFTGFDTDQTMLRIGAMNMMLHGVEAPNISWQDSLSDDNPFREKFSLILANPPFAGSIDKDAIAADLLSTVNTSKTELLFLALFIHMLKVGGRCASIVPNGILSNHTKAHSAIRKELVDNQKLEAVISMPSGIFQPYSGVATALLIFTKTNSGGTDKVWFYNMQADGLSLDPARVPVKDNDIPDIVNRFNDPASEEKRSRTEKSFFVPVREIIENDYSLTFGRYSAMNEETSDEGALETAIKQQTIEIERLFELSHSLERKISQNMKRIRSET